MYWVLKPLSQEEIGQRLQQIFGVDAEVFAGVAGVANRFHERLLAAVRPGMPGP